MNNSQRREKRFAYHREKRIEYQSPFQTMRALPHVAALSVLLLASHQTALTNAQTQPCACTPSVYNFTFNFALACSQTSILVNPAVTDVQCTTSPDVAVDPATAEAFSIQFTELDQNLQPLNSVNLNAPFFNGGSVVYESYIANAQEQGKVPRSLEVTIMARDATTPTILQTLLLQYSNSCTLYPVISTGQQIGWTVLVR
jgi:hypothetical protein